MANEATNSLIRSIYKDEQKNWLKMADKLDEESPFGKEPK